ncbi:YtzH-like family protein [Ectobacillus antri]|jgi:hypothetical protein|uniref:YtzH-like family protein n=1 Tax=Ectobacillus antri TaxID=2486280 RepID=A0ABT6H2P1_9BACI|nr:YtzH-like family protein [Ectobacillus antri]MDG4656473.1 YtzH-like family protein [Ectobacillus antri]MDG5753523.1 YtzH-like family protein [Ectobacillus antri]
MPLTHEHQVGILKDILTNHQSDCCGTVSECEQVERLVESLMNNHAVDDELKAMLGDVYHYSQTGKSSSDLGQHISNHQEQITGWISGMDSFS